MKSEQHSISTCLDLSLQTCTNKIFCNLPFAKISEGREYLVKLRKYVNQVQNNYRNYVFLNIPPHAKQFIILCLDAWFLRLLVTKYMQIYI